MPKLDTHALLTQSLAGMDVSDPSTRDDIDPLNMSGDELLQAINDMPGDKIPGVEPELPTTPETGNPHSNYVRKAWSDFKSTAPSAAFNPLASGQQELFGAGVDHHFYERYYEHPSFDKLGFTPFRDNESFYNENSSALSDLRRTYGEWASLGWLGLKDAAGFGSHSDAKTAKEFEHHMAIGSSTRGGTTEFLNNLFLNSGYTFGILGELAIEEIGLALITGASLGSAAPVTGSIAAARFTRAAMKIKEGFKVSRKIMNTLDNLKDVSKAKKFFLNTRNAAGRFINPLSSTTAFYKAKKSGKLTNLDGLATSTLGFASFYRDVRNIRLAYGESALEGGMVQNQMSKELLAEFIEKNGRPPTDEEAHEITNTAIAAGHSAAWQNLPTIFFSNKIVFDNMFKTFSPVKRLTDDIIEVASKGKFSFTKGIGYGKLEKGWKGLVQTAKNPKSYFRSGRNYFKANFAEGLQEIAQETISGATMDYYKNRGSKANILTGGYMNVLGENLEHMASAEGLEIFGSGFLMGGMVQGPQKLITGAWESKGRLSKKGRESYKETKAKKDEQLNKTINILNQFYEDPKKFLAPDLENMMEQHELAAAMIEADNAGDEKTFRDLKTDSHFSHAMTALEMGRFDSMVEQLKEELNLSDEDILAIPGVKSVEGYKASINKAVSRAKDIEKRYDVMQKQFPNPINPNQFSGVERIEAIKAHDAWSEAQKNAIFMGHSFDRTLERMNDILKTAKESSDLNNIPVSDFNKLFNFEDIHIELQDIEAQMKLMDTEEGTASKETKKIRKDRETTYKLLQSYEETMADYVSVGEDTVDAPGSEMTQENKDKFNAAADAFEKYIKHLGQKHNQPIFNDNLAETFQKIVDYFQLKDDSKRLTSAVNTLMNPRAFKEHVQLIAEINQYNYENRKVKIGIMLKAYADAKGENKFLNELYDAGIFFDPEDWTALKENGDRPETFYDVNTKDEIQRGTKKFTKALEIVNKHMEISGKEIPEHVAETTFSTKKRRKKFNDRRTYKDLAEQYGFDPKAESSDVSTMDVLGAITDSPHATKREKALARAYMNHVPLGATIKFVKNHDSPGSYQHDDEGGVVTIDARYSSREYRLGSSPIEFVILHEETHRLTVEALATDEAYNEQITELREKTLAHYESEAEDKTEGLVRRPGKPYYGLMDNAEFVAEAMSNYVFQKFLGSIPHEHNPQNKTIWDSFVTRVLQMLKNTFGKKNTTGTVLNAAIDIITGQIGGVDAPMTKMEYEDAKEKIKAQRDEALQELQEQAAGEIHEIVQDDVSYYRGQMGEPEIDVDGNLVIYGKIDPLYEKAGIKGSGVSMTDNLDSAVDYGHGQVEVAKNLASDVLDAEEMLMEIDEQGWTLIQISKDAVDVNNVVREAGEVKIKGDVLTIPKGKFKVQHIKEDGSITIGEIKAQPAQPASGGTVTQTTPYETPDGKTIQLPGTKEREWPGAPLLGEEWVSATGKEYTITEVTEKEVYAKVDGKKRKPISKKSWLDSLDNGKLKPWEGEFEGGIVPTEAEVEVPQEEIDAVHEKFNKKLDTLDKRYAESKVKEATEEAEVGDKAQAFEVTRDTPVERMPELLVERLVEGFINRNKDMELTKEDPMLPGFAEMNPLQISQSNAFRNWVRDSGFAKPEKIIETFFGPKKTSKDKIKTEKMRRDLVALGGYTREDTNIMSYAEIENAIDIGLSKEEAEASYEAEDLSTEANLKELINEAKVEIVELLAEPITMEEFKIAKAKAQSIFTEHILKGDESFTAAWFDEVIEDTLDRLAFSFTADKIKNGMIVQMKSGHMMEVVNANPKNKTILLVNPKTQNEFRVYRDKVQEQIKYVPNEAMKEPSVIKKMTPEKITPNDSDTSDESMKETKEIKDTAREDTEAGKKAGETDEDVEAQKQKRKDALKKNCK